MYLYDKIAGIEFTNFVYIFFYFVKDSSSLSEWSSMVQTMMQTGTLAPLPINQELEPIFKILLTSAVENIVHDDGTPLDVTNVIDVAISSGYLKYCSLFDCGIPACPATVKLDGNVYHEIQGEY